MVPACRLHQRRARHRDNDTCPSRPRSETAQVSLSPYVSGTSQTAVPPPEHKVSACEQMSLRAGPIRGQLGFQQSSVSPGWSESPVIFRVRFWGDFSSWTWYTGMGATVWCQGPSLPWKDHLSEDIPPDAQLPHADAWPACFVSPFFLPVLIWPLIYSLSYRSYN